MLATRVLPASPNFRQAKHGQNGFAASFCQQGICCPVHNDNFIYLARQIQVLSCAFRADFSISIKVSWEREKFNAETFVSMTISLCPFYPVFLSSCFSCSWFELVLLSSWPKNISVHPTSAKNSSVRQCKSFKQCLSSEISVGSVSSVTRVNRINSEKSITNATGKKM